MSSESTKEPQYQRSIEIAQNQGLTPLGLMINQAWKDDPRHLVFTFSRYKFVSKMLSGKKSVLEVGCADAFCSRLLLQEVEKLTVTDFDPVFIKDVEARMDPDWKFETAVHDFLSGPMPKKFDAAYAMDVIEHIEPDKEHPFCKNIVDSLNEQGVLLLGCPSKESQVYASPPSKAGHVNCKSGKELKVLLEKYFHHVFMFSMNDEMVHTGYFPMAHYILGIGCGKKSV